MSFSLQCSHTNSLLVYVGTLVASVGLKGLPSRKVKQVDAEELFRTSMHLLDIALLSHDKLYMELFYFITGSRVISENLR